MDFSFSGSERELRGLVECICDRCRRERAVAVVTLKVADVSITFFGDFIMNVTVDGGPITLSVDKFVDDKGNTTTDADVPVWASSDATIITVAVDPANKQGAIATVVGKVGAAQVTAAFGDQTKLGTPGNYLLTGAVNVSPGLAVSGTIEGTGPGVTP